MAWRIQLQCGAQRPFWFTARRTPLLLRLLDDPQPEVEVRDERLLAEDVLARVDGRAVHAAPGRRDARRGRPPRCRRGASTSRKSVHTIRLGVELLLRLTRLSLGAVAEHRHVVAGVPVRPQVLDGDPTAADEADFRPVRHRVGRGIRQAAERGSPPCCSPAGGRTNRPGSSGISLLLPGLEQPHRVLVQRAQGRRVHDALPDAADLGRQGPLHGLSAFEAVDQVLDGVLPRGLQGVHRQVPARGVLRASAAAPFSRSRSWRCFPSFRR